VGSIPWELTRPCKKCHGAPSPPYRGGWQVNRDGPGETRWGGGGRAEGGKQGGWVAGTVKK
jgi:hypothetical protein